MHTNITLFIPVPIGGIAYSIGYSVGYSIGGLIAAAVLAPLARHRGESAILWAGLGLVAGLAGRLIGDQGQAGMIGGGVAIAAFVVFTLVRGNQKSTDAAAMKHAEASAAEAETTEEPVHQ